MIPVSCTQRFSKGQKYSVLYPSDYELFRPHKTNIQQKGVIGELDYNRHDRLFVQEYGIKASTTVA